MKVLSYSALLCPAYAFLCFAPLAERGVQLQAQKAKRPARAAPAGLVQAFVRLCAPDFVLFLQARPAA